MSPRWNPAQTSINQQNGREIGFRHRSGNVFYKSILLVKNITEISKEKRRNRETVSRIVHGPEMRNLVQAMREKWFGLALDAISAVQHALTDQKDGRLGFQLLSSIGVIPSPEEKELLAMPPAEAGSDDDAQVRKIMAAMIESWIERASIFGYRDLELEKELEKVNGTINYETRKIEPLKKKTKT